MTSTQEKIKELEQRLSVGFDKLRDLELAGLWDERMYAYWCNLNETYKQLCKLPKLFQEYNND